MSAYNYEEYSFIEESLTRERCCGYTTTLIVFYLVVHGNKGYSTLAQFGLLVQLKPGHLISCGFTFII